MCLHCICKYWQDKPMKSLLAQVIHEFNESSAQISSLHTRNVFLRKESSVFIFDHKTASSLNIDKTKDNTCRERCFLLSVKHETRHFGKWPLRNADC